MWSLWSFPPSNSLNTAAQTLQPAACCSAFLRLSTSSGAERCRAYSQREAWQMVPKTATTSGVQHKENVWKCEGVHEFMMGSVVQTPCNKESRFMNTRLDRLCVYTIPLSSMAWWLVPGCKPNSPHCSWCHLLLDLSGSATSTYSRSTALRRYDVRYELLRRTKAISHSLACDRYKQVANLELPIVTVFGPAVQTFALQGKIYLAAKKMPSHVCLIIPRWIPWRCTPPSRKRWWHCSGPQRKETTVVWDLPCGWAGELRSYTVVEVVEWWWKTFVFTVFTS